MKGHYTALGGRLVIEVEGQSITDLFDNIGTIAEVLDADDKCGACQSQNIYPRAREAQGYTYYEMCCANCTARLSFGQHRQGGTLWAKRKDKQGNELPNRGWAIYTPHDAPRPTGTDQSAPQRPASTTQDPPELVSLLRRARSKEQVYQVQAELGDRIAAKLGPEEADRLWKVWVDERLSDADMVRRMWDKLQEPVRR